MTDDLGFGMGNELTHETIVILEGDDAFILVARSGLLKIDLLPDQALDPKTD
jgi:hypothetical protein